MDKDLLDLREKEHYIFGIELQIIFSQHSPICALTLILQIWKLDLNVSEHQQ